MIFYRQKSQEQLLLLILGTPLLHTILSDRPFVCNTEATTLESKIVWNGHFCW